MLPCLNFFNTLQNLLNISNIYANKLFTYRTEENIAVRVSSVVMEMPIRASTILAGTRKQSHVITMKNTEGR